MTGVWECYRQGPEQPDPRQVTGPESLGELDEQVERILVCLHCGQRVTSRDMAIEIEGRHTHTFFNPAGILFEIGCFADAPGCAVSGPPTSEFAWFAGTRWRFATCRACSAHLGWSFLPEQPQGAPFFGLILNRLREAAD